MEEIRRGNVVIIREEEDKLTTIRDMDGFREFKLDVLKRLDKLEKDMDTLHKGQVKVK